MDVEGTLYWDTGGAAREPAPAGNSIVKYTNGDKTGTVEADENGDFAIPGLKGSDALSLVVLHENGRVSRADYDPGQFSDPLDVRVLPQEGPTSQRIGFAVLAGLIFALGMLTHVYLETHQEAMANSRTQYVALQEALQAVPIKKGAATASTLINAQNKVRAARPALDSLRSRPSEDLVQLLDQVVAFELSSDSGNIADLEALVSRADAEIGDPMNRFLWSAWPWRFIEIWSWGLLGVLLAKIVRIGWYLRSSTYSANGTWMHIAHVVATPFLALISVMVLSFVKIEGDSQTIVQFDSPLLMVVGACLLSTNPWGLWDFVFGRGNALRGNE